MEESAPQTIPPAFIGITTIKPVHPSIKRFLKFTTFPIGRIVYIAVHF